MALTSTIVIPAQTAAVTTPVPIELQQNDLPATIQATKLAGAEQVEILFSADGKAPFEPLSQDGSDLVMTETTNNYAIVSPMYLAVTKQATVAASGVFIVTSNPKGAV